MAWELTLYFFLSRFVVVFQSVDVEPEVNLRQVLVYQMHLDTELRVEELKEKHPKNLKSAIVRFSSEERYQEARAQLGGGMRGKFVVDPYASSTKVVLV